MDKTILLKEMDYLVKANGIAFVIVSVAEVCRMQAVREQRNSSDDQTIKEWQKLGNSLEKALREFPKEKWYMDE